MALSETGKWLEQALERVCSDQKSALQLDSETLYSLVAYCEMASPADANEYLLNIVGDERCKAIIAEYLRRRGGTNSLPDVGMQPYHKPPGEELSTGNKKTPKQKPLSSEGPAGGSTHSNLHHKSPLYSGHGLLSAENIVHKGKRPVGKGKKGGKGISLAEASKGHVFARGSPCSCQCTRHRLINNCLSCGRIVCEQEGEGPCHFCGALVLKEGSNYGGLEGMRISPATKAEVAAEEFKNRLVEYDRTAASRTTVIDDQGDYFEIGGNTWLSEKEKDLLKQRQDEEERIAEERRKRVVVSLDLLGRKVVMAGHENGKEVGDNFSILGGDMLVGETRPNFARVKPNPYLQETPIFIGERQTDTPQSNGGSAPRHLFSKKCAGSSKSDRIQHDDPIVEALIGHNLNDLGINEEVQWSPSEGPKASTSNHVEQHEEFFECQSEIAGLQEHSATSTSGRGQLKKSSGVCSRDRPDQGLPFDICPSVGTGKQRPVVLAPSALSQKQLERTEIFLNETDAKLNQSNRVLQPGMVLLKRWLSKEQQVEIVKHCRMLGKGPGGFYKPQYGSDSKMHLQMMCLGMQWEPTSKSYAARRQHHDNALAPSIPDMFIRLVERALSAARLVATREFGGKTTQVVLGNDTTIPDMVPNVCIVNFYERSGNLGLHQDKDESAESLQKQCPVVSFSIGDTAEFVFGKERDEEKTAKENLESGDVLIFGGPSRMIYHGVSHLVADTSPKWLSQKHNLRPGRLNLTFRQY